ncbi:fimbrial protein [Burkholderia sp. PU8-34]
MLFLAGWGGQAQAAGCKWDTPPPPSELKASALPATVTLRAAAIGGVMATAMVNLPPYPTLTRFTCASDYYGMEVVTNTLPLQDASKQIYESGIPGVGIRISFSGTGWGTLAAPFNRQTTANIVYSVPGRVVVEFIRTGMDVGRGSITPFDFSSVFHLNTVPQSRIPVTGTQLATTLVNNIYFTSCYNPASAPTVNLGRPTIGELTQGNTIRKDFSLDIRCDGMNQTTKPPVSIYFEGNAPRDGLLLTDGQGQAGMAQGVGVSLTNDKGVALPFAKAKAMPMTWTSSGTDSELYRFAGKARYIASGGEIKAGKADATLTYVLQYN